MTLIEALNKPRCRLRRPPFNDDTARICWLMEAATAAVVAVPVDELRAPSRRAPAVAFARQCAMYLAHVGSVCATLRLGGCFGATALPPPMLAPWSKNGATIRRSTIC